MHIVIAIPIGVILTTAAVLWVAWHFWRSGVERKRLRRLRERQEANRLKMLERQLRPPLKERLKGRFLTKR